MVLSCARMREAEEALFARGVEAEDLMEEAGAGCARAMLQFLPEEKGQIVLFVGKGHNGGDALVVGRHLARLGWLVHWRLVADRVELAPLTRTMLERMEPLAAASLDPHLPVVAVVDGLLGLGATGPLRPAWHELTEEITRLQQDQQALVFAIDLPTGVDGDSGFVHEGAVRADFTLTIEHFKTGLLEDSALDHVGRLVQIRVPRIEAQGEEGRVVITPDLMRGWLPPLPFTAHKGEAGRVGLIAGARGYSGAGILASLGASHAGAGLVTLFAREAAWPILAQRAPVEVMVRPVSSYLEALDAGMDVIGIGPGLGLEQAAEVLEVVQQAECPVVVDADALNVLAQSTGSLQQMRGPRLLTPHPGEMRRLFPQATEFPDRSSVAEAFVREHGLPVVYKGARSIVAAPDHSRAFNSTGTSGMASGGMGDVLTGVASALLARGLSPWQAGCLGSWWIGRAAELASQGTAPEGLTAAKMAASLPDALKEFRRACF